MRVSPEILMMTGVHRLAVHLKEDGSDFALEANALTGAQTCLRSMAIDGDVPARWRWSSSWRRRSRSEVRVEG